MIKIIMLQLNWWPSKRDLQQLNSMRSELIGNSAPVGESSELKFFAFSEMFRFDALREPLSFS